MTNDELIRFLVSRPSETEWIEFKQDYINYQEIGEYISALSNSAALQRQSYGYILWGVNDKSHEISGTQFMPKIAKIGNQELENWLATQLEPRINFDILECNIENKNIVIFRIQAASYQPVRFRGHEFIRIGSYKKRLSEHPEKERNLWALFREHRFETGISFEDASADDVLNLIHYPAFFKLLNQPLPENKNTILAKLESERIIKKVSVVKYGITNLGAMLFASQLSDFPNVSRKALRIIMYKSKNRIETIRESIGSKGYAVGFQGAIQRIIDQLPQNEQITKAIRKEIRMYPEIAIRELVANALIHQDFNISGAGPMVEIFEDRMEISNPGLPLINPLRFIDEPPQSKNEALAALMRRMGVCEERGSGIDKAIAAVEAYQLPAPDFRIAGNSTVAILFAPRDFSSMDKEERIRACYQHACLLYVSGQRMTNTSLRQRLGIKDSSYPLASRIIRDAIDIGLIKAHFDGSSSKRDTSYLPFWA